MRDATICFALGAASTQGCNIANRLRLNLQGQLVAFTWLDILNGHQNSSLDASDASQPFIACPQPEAIVLQ